MIELTNITKTYRMGDSEIHALRGVSLKIMQGEFVAIMGPSGSGKSTMMHILGLLDVPDSGSYKLLGEEVSKREEDDLSKLRSSEIGFVFQQFNLLSRTSAVDNVALPLIYKPSNWAGDSPEDLLKSVGLGSRTHHKPNELSGGQQQRVAIARALVNRPKIIMADEPTGNLDTASGEEIMGILTQLNQRGITVILVTHEPDIAQHAARIIRMRDGQVQSDERLRNIKSVESILNNSKSVAEHEISGVKTRPWRFYFKEASLHFKQAIRALLASKMRTILSTLGIIIGVAAVIGALAVGTGAQQSVKSTMSSLGSNMLVLRPAPKMSGGVALQAGSVSRLRIDDARLIMENVQGLEYVTPVVRSRVQAVYQDSNANTEVVGATQTYLKIHSNEVAIGSTFTEKDDKERARVALLGQTVVKSLFGEKNPVGETIKINRVIFQVIGVLTPKGVSGPRDEDDIIIVPLSTAMHRLFGSTYVDTIDMQASSAERLNETQDDVQNYINKIHPPPISQGSQGLFRVYNYASIQQAFSKVADVLSYLLAAIAAISLVVGGIGIMNIMLVSVTERTREIGLRKAVGAKRSDILGQFLIEALTISLIGGLMGVLLGAAIALLCSLIFGFAIPVTVGAVLVATCSSITIGIIFGLWPAQKASRLNPIQALRYE